jgi:hypothetical protein
VALVVAAETAGVLRYWWTRRIPQGLTSEMTPTTRDSVEDTDAKGMLEQSHNARNKQGAACRHLITLLETKADVYGCHVLEMGGLRS